MTYLVPDMEAEIIPGKSAAGFELGILFDDFIKQVKYKKFESRNDFNPKVEEKGTWGIIHRDEISFNLDYINEIQCKWENSVELVFDMNKLGKLTWIYLYEGYKGKLLNILGIGDRLDSVKDEFDFDFYGDAHYLMYKEGSPHYGDIVGVEIGTNYLIEYSEEYPDQIITSFLVYIFKDQR
ncbi:hypothetical protein B9T31_13540 [Acinetobacter sp. ANC 4558]|uniref:hypothetical protein n=1 Tax=Acinetobacter sp. ANC 4558 TaxID=1977876 RepID=UPI000A337D0A|nr:hypothetical protein [Acinetobacter sp. ANC 4558]OTG84175.1 hypothetical protein B9T31_13540 [Acinetobacter sp. ANC 4558]